MARQASSQPDSGSPSTATLGSEDKIRWQRADDEVRKNLPPGVKLLRTLRGHTDWIGRIAWSPDGRLLASPSADKTIRLWDAGTGECLYALEGHSGRVISVAFDPTGDTLASGSEDETVKLWDAASGRLHRTHEGHHNSVESVAFSPFGMLLASGSQDATVNLWESRGSRLIHALQGHQEGVLSVVFDTVGRHVATGSRDKSVKLWEAASGRLLRTLEGHQHFVLSVAFDPAGRQVASGSVDKTVKLWTAASGRLFRTLEGHTDEVRGISFSPDGRCLASKSGDGSIRLWQANTGDCFSILSEPTANVWPPGIAFHPHRPLLATVGSDPGASIAECDRVIHLYELDLDLLLGQKSALPKNQIASTENAESMTELSQRTSDQNTPSEAQQRINAYRQLEVEAGYSLDLSNLDLAKLPPEVCQLTSLVRLNLAANKLTILPDEINKLASLECLVLVENQFTTLPQAIEQLTELRELYLTDNQLTTLPSWIGKLTRLTALGVSGNQLTSLPPQIGQLRDLASLRVTRNQLTALPPEIKQLTSLTWLSLHDNPALGLPSDVLGPRWFEVESGATAAKPQSILQYYFQKELSSPDTPSTTSAAKPGLQGMASFGNDETSVIDQLGRSRPAQALARFINSKGTRTPLTVSVEGPWGAGKTNFMKLVEARLKDQSDKKGLPPITVWFNPWRHTEASALWAAFAFEFARQLKKQATWWRWLTGPLRMWLSPPSKQNDSRLRYATRWLALIILFVVGAGSLGIVALEMIHLWDCNEHTPKGLWDGLVDDLSDGMNAVFVLGMDREKVAAGIAVKHESLLPYLYSRERAEELRLARASTPPIPPSNAEETLYSRGLEFGYSFIEKFIQLPFRLPVPGDEGMRRYLCELTRVAYAPKMITADVQSYVQTPPVHKQVEDPQSPKPLKLPSVKETITSATELRPAAPVVEDDLSAVVEAIKSQEPQPEATMPEVPSFVKSQEVQREEMLSFEKALSQADAVATDKALHEALELILPFMGNNPRRLKQALNLLRLWSYLAAEWLRRDSYQSGNRSEPVITLKKLAKVIAIELCWPTKLLALAEQAQDPKIDIHVLLELPNGLKDIGGVAGMLRVCDLRAVLSVAAVANERDSIMDERVMADELE